MKAWDVLMDAGETMAARRVNADRWVSGVYGVEFENTPPNLAPVQVAFVPHSRLICVIEVAPEGIL